MRSEIINDEKLHLALRRIGLALSASHNLVVTDIPGVEIDKTHWRTDHSQEIGDLDYIKNILINTGIYHGCKCCKIPQEEYDPTFLQGIKDALAKEPQKLES